jgi:two-component system nitrogen regulation response regulator NtrX
MKALINYSWPGNIRELRNLIERLVILEEESTLILDHLPSAIAVRSQDKPDLDEVFVGNFRETKGRFVAQFEKEYLTDMLLRHKGNVSRCAREAGMERSGFQRLMQRHSLKSEDFRYPLQ